MKAVGNLHAKQRPPDVPLRRRPAPQAAWGPALAGEELRAPGTCLFVVAFGKRKVIGRCLAPPSALSMEALKRPRLRISDDFAGGDRVISSTCSPAKQQASASKREAPGRGHPAPQPARQAIRWVWVPVRLSWRWQRPCRAPHSCAVVTAAGCALGGPGRTRTVPCKRRVRPEPAGPLRRAGPFTAAAASLLAQPCLPTPCAPACV